MKRGETEPEKPPQQVVQDFYAWIFQIRVPVPWTDVIMQQRAVLFPNLWALLREHALKNDLDFEPFLDSDGEAVGFKVTETQIKGDAAMISVTIHGAKRNRLLVIELHHAQAEWRISNIYYQWAQVDDLLSLLKRKAYQGVAVRA